MADIYRAPHSTTSAIRLLAADRQESDRPPAAAGTWELSVLGAVAARHHGREFPLGPLRHRVLFGLLLIRLGAVVSTDQLIDELWSGRPPSRPKATLQTYVSHLRRAMGHGGLEPGLRFQAHGYILDLDPEMVDAHRFERLVGDGRQYAADKNFDKAQRTLGEALAMWRGQPYLDLIAHLPIADESQRLEYLRLSAIDAWAHAGLALGDTDAVVTELRPTVQRNPAQERIIGHLMTGLYRLGQQAEALQVYERTRRYLADELGIDPSPELQDVHSLILRQRLGTLEPAPWTAPEADDAGDGHESPAAAAASKNSEIATAGPAAPTTPPATPATTTAPPAHAPDPYPFVGRKRELELVSAYVAGGLNGGNYLTAVLGPAGIGKTELVERLTRRLREQRQEVVWAQCRSGDGIPPYWVWAQVFRRLAATRPQPLHEGRAHHGRLLAPLQVGTESGHVCIEELDASASFRFYTQDAICETLRSVVQQAPLVIVLEDIDQADRPSLELLDLLRTRLHDEAVSLVVTADEGAVPGGPMREDLMVGGTAAALVNDTRTRIVRLRGLSLPETGELIAAQTGSLVTSEVARRLHERSQGNPYVLGQLLTYLGDPCCLPDGGWPSDLLDLRAGGAGPVLAGCPEARSST